MLYSDQNIKIDNISVKQVNINSARKAFNKGKNVYFHSCNLRIDNSWQSPMKMNKDNINCQDTFDNIVDAFHGYNCDNERGNRVIFFIEK